MGNELTGWTETLVMFFQEIISPLKSEFPESYTKAGDDLRTLGESVYPENILQQWRDVF